MGIIRDDFGRIAIESRSESFYIHADYGYEPQKKRLLGLSLGTYFYFPGNETLYQLVGLHHSDGHPDWPRAEYREKDSDETYTVGSDQEVIWCDDENGVPNTEAQSDHPLGSLWRDYPHPEFEKEDLDDLIAALRDYKESLDD